MKLGVRCSKCGTTHHEVVETRKSKDAIVRRRKCFNGHPFTTQETAVKEAGGHKREKVRASVLGFLEKRETDPTITVHWIAEKVGVSVDTVYRIQRGERLRRNYK